jgi:hypothetical protein
MDREDLLVLKEKPSFEGELCIRVTEEHQSEGRAKYFLICQKNPPLSADEFSIFTHVLSRVVDRDREEITKSINWQREVPPLEAKTIATILEHQVVTVAPEGIAGLDGTTYTLLIKRGFNVVRFTWWCEPPARWQALGELAKTLLKVADVASVTVSQQQSQRKRLMQQLRLALDDERTKLQSEREELVRTHNRRCHELAQSMRNLELKCPNCGVHTSDFRFIDKGPVAKSYFICKACGRSFRPEDL